MSNVRLPDNQWSKILVFLRQQQETYVGDEEACRRFIEGVLWMARSGAQWRLLPSEYGGWNTVYKRFNRWSRRGIWEKMHEFFADDPDMESVIIDSTIVRAHPCAAGAGQSEGDPSDQALGRSRGGFSTKIHLLVDALGNPLKFILTGGQSADVNQALPLLAGVNGATYGIMDKAYDADKVLDYLESKSIIPVIPPTKNRKEQRDYGWHIYKERHLVECFINKIKQYRYIFSRFDKTSRNFMSFLRFVAVLIWLR